MIASIILLGLSISQSFARDVPSNVRDFYNAVMPGPCPGTALLQGAFYNTEAGPNSWEYCQQDAIGQAIFLKGSNGSFANMDIDCDGTQSSSSHDTRCQSSTDTQGQTAFQQTVQSYGVTDLDARIHSYIVFGNQGNYTPTFDPTAYNVHPLSIAAVVCGDQLIYAVWGDINGDDGPPLVGEASLATGTLCYGNTVTGNNGHDENDVLYIVFTGSDAVPGKDGAVWNATSIDEFESSLAAIGDVLIQRLTINNSTADNSSTSSNAAGNNSSKSSAMLIPPPILGSISTLLIGLHILNTLAD